MRIDLAPRIGLELAAEWPLIAGWTASVAVAIETAGGAIVTLGWQAEF